jgi:hypothetical protein
MYKKFLFAISICLFLQPGYVFAQEASNNPEADTPSSTPSDSETAPKKDAEASSVIPAGMHASLIASRAGGFGLATRTIVGGVFVAGLIAVALEVATDDGNVAGSTTSSSSN